MSHVKSFYAATANQNLSFTQLSSNMRTQVCVIGGGFTGLNTAINLAKKDYDVVLIESEKIGWGASGRNGGQLISGFSSFHSSGGYPDSRPISKRLVPVAPSASRYPFSFMRFTIFCIPLMFSSTF